MTKNISLNKKSGQKKNAKKPATAKSAEKKTVAHKASALPKTDDVKPVQSDVKRSASKKSLIVLSGALIAAAGTFFLLQQPSIKNTSQEQPAIQKKLHTDDEYVISELPPETFVSPKTQKETEKLYEGLTMIEMPRVFVETLPADWHISSTADKTLFMKIITAQILRANAHILQEKKRLNFLQEKFLNNQEWTDSDEAFFQELLKKYDVYLPKKRAAQIQELIGKVDIIPPSFAVAQAIMFTDWGQKNQNSPFGEYGWVDGEYQPLKFNSLTEATDSFALQLNSRFQMYSFHNIRRKYIPLRKIRLLSDALLKDIRQYMDFDKEYIDKLSNTYQQGLIRELDLAQFADEPKNILFNQ